MRRLHWVPYYSIGASGASVHSAVPILFLYLNSTNNGSHETFIEVIKIRAYTDKYCIYFSSITLLSPTINNEDTENT